MNLNNVFNVSYFLKIKAFILTDYLKITDTSIGNWKMKNCYSAGSIKRTIGIKRVFTTKVPPDNSLQRILLMWSNHQTNGTLIWANIVKHSFEEVKQTAGATSVTRWLKYLFNIWPFTSMYICSKVKKFKSRLQILPNTIQTLKKLPKTF